MKNFWKRSTLQHSQNSEKLPVIGIHIYKCNKEKLSNILPFNYETVSELKCNVYVLFSQFILIDTVWLFFLLAFESIEILQPNWL